MKQYPISADCFDMPDAFDGNIKWNNQVGFFLSIRILLIKCTFFKQIKIFIIFFIYFLNKRDR